VSARLVRVLSSGVVQSPPAIAGFAADPSELLHTERVLALGRAMLAIVSLLALRFAADEPGRFAPVVDPLLLLFGVVAGAMLLVAWRRPGGGSNSRAATRWPI
jgi:hypothetical protein